MALSTYLPIQEHLIAHKDEIPVDTPIYMSHETEDDRTRFYWAFQSKNTLKQELKCEDVTFEKIPHLGHSINGKVIESMIQFLKRILE